MVKMRVKLLRQNLLTYLSLVAGIKAQQELVRLVATKPVLRSIKKWLQSPWIKEILKASLKMLLGVIVTKYHHRIFHCNLSITQEKLMSLTFYRIAYTRLRLAQIDQTISETIKYKQHKQINKGYFKINHYCKIKTKIILILSLKKIRILIVMVLVN